MNISAAQLNAELSCRVVELNDYLTQQNFSSHLRYHVEEETGNQSVVGHVQYPSNMTISFARGMLLGALQQFGFNASEAQVKPERVADLQHMLEVSTNIAQQLPATL